MGNVDTVDVLDVLGGTAGRGILCEGKDQGVDQGVDHS